MIVLDTSFLLDYLDGVAATAEFLEAHSGKPFHAPSVSLWRCIAVRLVLVELKGWIRSPPLSSGLTPSR